MRTQTLIDCCSYWLVCQREPDLTMKRRSVVLEWARTKCYRAQDYIDAPPPVLARWLRSLEAGALENWGSVDGKMDWYVDIPHLMMVGTPPYGPLDFVDVRTDGTLRVPSGRILEVHNPIEYKEPVYAD